MKPSRVAPALPFPIFRRILGLIAGQTGLLRMTWDNVDRRDELFAAIEGTAFHTRVILDRMEQHGVPIDRVINAGGIPQKNEVLNPVYACVLNKPVLIPQGDVTSIGSAIFAAPAAGAFRTIEDAQAALCLKHRVIEPDPHSARVYEELYALYRELYFALKIEDLVVTDLDGKIIEGILRPSSDLPTHLILYRAFTGIGGVAHSHSRAATSWAQAQREIPCFGTTHADYFRGSVPVTEALTPSQIRSDYEANTGHAIVRRFAKLDPLHSPAVLVSGHAPFCWGTTAAAAAHTAVVVEEIAAMAIQTLVANPKTRPISRHLHQKHFLRKHRGTAYYGQK